MTTKAKISPYKQEKIFEIFWQDLDATKWGEILSINRNTMNAWYNKFRRIIVNIEEAEIQEWWVFELDESYFWPTRIKWKRGRWAWWKTIVFGLLKRNWKVYTQIIPDAKAQSIIPIIRWKIASWSIINTDWWKSYDWLVDIGYEKHYRVHHWVNEFARWKQHINWIESFWSFTKRRLKKLIEYKKINFTYIWKNLNLDIIIDERKI
jgi:transposase-like protein